MPPNPARLQQAKAIPFWKMDAGLVRNVPPTRIPDLGCSETQNVYFSDGRVQPRPPFREYTSGPVTGSAVPANHLSTLKVQAGTQYLLRSELDPNTGNLNVYSSDGAAWTKRTPANLVGSESQPPQSVQFKGEWIFCPGNDEVQKWTGSGNLVSINSLQANVQLRPPSKPYYVAATATRLFLANGIDNSGVRVPWRVWWSETLDSTIWSNGAGLPSQGSAGYQDLIHDNSEITGIQFHSGRQIIVFKRSSIYRAEFKGGPVWYDFVPITTAHGCVAGGTICAFRDVLFWLGDDYNIHALPFGGQPQTVGDAIRPRLQALLSLPYASRASAVVDPVLGLYWLFVPVSGESTVHKIFVMNLLTGAWAEGDISDSSIRVMCSLQYKQNTVAPTSLFGSRDGKIYSFSGTSMTDGATAYEAYVWSRTFDFMEVFKDAGETGEFHKLSLQGSSGTAEARARVGTTIKQVENADPVTFGTIDMDGVIPDAYESDRTSADRFGQFGVHWPSGTATPMVVDGVTAWGLWRGDTR